MLYRVNDAFCLWPEIALVKIETIAENLSLKFLNAVGSILNLNLCGFMTFSSFISMFRIRLVCVLYPICKVL